ncbi:hypothetical protein Pla163_17440 [Planctomycetes bacterium Pla163]|uniref:Aerotolerance regulator N-terminal domain-containing protein n=1 Tax=Rohdeia mirabilis TaxID=2528008 RepID=A0A518CZJ8_9BACT|nr:hypothetical protein Pla163_17440 [Planctomycetes bacterium Pla163]
MIDGFANPALAFGAFLAVVPLVIHLLNRRRHRPLSFGAMRFVMAAHKRTRRRARLESLLLLLLRMLAVGLLGFALARPFVGGDSLLTGLGERRRDLVLMVDTSASTDYREGLGSVFQSIVARARDLTEELDESKGDRVRLILVDDAPRQASGRSVREALAVIDALEAPSPTAADLVGALALVTECIDEWGTDVEVRLLTDMQRGTFLERGGATDVAGAGSSDVTDGDDATEVGARPRLGPALDRLEQRGTRLVVEDLGSGTTQPANAGVVGLEVLGPAPSIGAPARVEVTVRNFGPDPISALRVALAVEDTRLPVQAVDIAAGATASTTFTVRWQASGARRLTASIAADGLAVDDERSRVVEVAPPVRVLLVNGAPSDDSIEFDEVGLLAAVLAPPAEAGFALEGTAPFEPRIVLPAELEAGSVELASADVIWLANVSQVSTRTIDRLTDWVRAGGALVFSMGDAIAPATFGERLFSDDGTGLLPARLLGARAVSDRRREYYRVQSFDAAHPALRFFADERFRRLLVEVPIFEYVACVPLPNARVLIDLDDGGAPLLVERDFGRGRTYLFTTSIDPAWTRLPQSPKTLVPLAHEWLRFAARRPLPPVNVEIGDTLVVETDGFPRQPVAILPDGRRREIDAEPVDIEGERWSLVVESAADVPGIWSAEVAGEIVAHFAVGFDASEGDLVRYSGGELESVHPALIAGRSVGEDRAEAGASQGASGELWRPLIALVLAFLVIESLYSAFIGSRRRGTA